MNRAFRCKVNPSWQPSDANVDCISAIPVYCLHSVLAYSVFTSGAQCDASVSVLCTSWDWARLVKIALPLSLSLCIAKQLRYPTAQTATMPFTHTMFEFFPCVWDLAFAIAHWRRGQVSCLCHRVDCPPCNLHGENRNLPLNSKSNVPLEQTSFKVNEELRQINTQDVNIWFP